MKEENKNITSTWEKLAYSLGDAGAGFVMTFTGSFVTLYYTDSVLMAAAFIGTFMLLVRICDGISDILMGMLIERTNTKIGKARPWFGISIIPLIATFFLMFNVPSGLGENGKKIYVVATYFAMTVIAYTMNNLSFHAMLSRISLVQDDRNKISAIRGIFAFITGLILAIGTQPLLSSFGGEESQNAWTKLALIYALICLVFQIICFSFTKEKISTENNRAGQKSKETNIRQGVVALLKTKYCYLAIAVFICSYIISGSFLGVAVYYVRDVLGNSSYYMLVALAYVIPMVIGMVAVPKLIRKFSKKYVMAAGGFLAAIGCIIGLLFSRQLPMVMVAVVILSLGCSPFSSIMFTLAPDIVDYLEKKINIRIEGLATSVTSCGIKVGTGIGSAMIGWGLALGGYQAQAAVQLNSVLTAEIVLYFGVPLVVTVIRAICMLFWDIEKR